MSNLLRFKKPEILRQLPPDAHAVIEASAGTGKTYTLEHLVIDLLSLRAARRFVRVGAHRGRRQRGRQRQRVLGWRHPDGVAKLERHVRRRQSCRRSW